MYCVKCRKQTETKDMQNSVSKNERPMIRGVCTVCGTTKTQFVKGVLSKHVEGGDLVSSLNMLTSNTKLPWGKFPGEMHLPGHQFTGPGTRLDLRLLPDGTPHPWSTPINRVDRAAHRHDLAYARHSDTANRNIADREMVDELNSIQNPTMRERIERSLVKPILNTKAKFGFGVPTKSDLKKSLQS